MEQAVISNHILNLPRYNREIWTLKRFSPTKFAPYYPFPVLVGAGNKKMMDLLSLCVLIFAFLSSFVRRD